MDDVGTGARRGNRRGCRGAAIRVSRERTVAATAEERRGGLLQVGCGADRIRPGEAAAGSPGGHAADDGDGHDPGRRGAGRGPRRCRRRDHGTPAPARPRVPWPRAARAVARTRPPGSRPSSSRQRVPSSSRRRSRRPAPHASKAGAIRSSSTRLRLGVRYSALRDGAGGAGAHGQPRADDRTGQGTAPGNSSRNARPTRRWRKR
jgi:hypothetical protein